MQSFGWIAGGALLLLLNIAATWAAWRAPGYTRSQRGYQMAFIWLVPTLGAILCLVAARVGVAHERRLADPLQLEDPDPMLVLAVLASHDPAIPPGSGNAGGGDD